MQMYKVVPQTKRECVEMKFTDIHVLYTHQVNT